MGSSVACIHNGGRPPSLPANLLKGEDGSFNIVPLGAKLLENFVDVHSWLRSPNSFSRSADHFESPGGTLSEEGAMKSIYVGNLAFRTTEQSIHALFEPFGRLQHVTLMTDRATGHSRGFAFVEMADAEEAAHAIAELNGCTVDGRVLKVHPAQARAGR